jgi:hypothetical protein
MGEAAKKDISKNTLLVLLILTLIISVVSTWTILHHSDFIKPTETPAQHIKTQTAEVSVSIISPTNSNIANSET